MRDYDAVMNQQETRPIPRDEAEQAYRTWCAQMEVDPEATASMVAYEELFEQ